jgi:Holliday junction resolvase
MMTMSSYNKAKGTKFETDVMKYLRKLGHFAERLAKAGASDEGDIVCIIAGQTYILECKNRKSINLPQFWDEAQTEAANYAKARGLDLSPPAFVIVKRRHASIEKAWVIQPLEKWIDDASTRRTDNNDGNTQHSETGRERHERKRR